MIFAILFLVFNISCRNSLVCIIPCSKSRTQSSASYLDGTPVAPWMDPPEQRPTPSKSSPQDEAQSRLTSVADAEIQNILPSAANRADTKTSNVPTQDPGKGKDVLPPIEGVKGERERLLSRTSSMGSRRMKRRSQSHLSGQDEEEEDDESDAEGLAPWLTPAGKKKEKIRLSRGSRSRATTRQSRRPSSTDGDELKELQDVLSGNVKAKSRAAEMDALGEISNTDRDSSLDRNTGSVTKRDGQGSKARKKGRGTVMAVPRIRLSIRRPSSAKIPKELQERLEKIMEKERRARSSHDRRPKKEVHGFTDSESDWDMKRGTIRYRIDPTKIVKDKKGKDRLKLPKINLGPRKRRTSSAKLPKEMQEKLASEMEKNRKIRSSLGHIPKEHFIGVSETEAEVSANETDRTDQEKVSKVKPITKPDTKTIEGDSNYGEPISKNVTKGSETDLVKKDTENEEKELETKDPHEEKAVENLHGEVDISGSVTAELKSETKASDAVAKSVISRSSVGGSRGTVRRKQAADDTAFEDDDGLSVVDSLRGGAVNRLGETSVEPHRIDSRKLDEELVDSAVEEDEEPEVMAQNGDFPLDQAITQVQVDSESHDKDIVVKEEVGEFAGESQDIFDPISRLTQQSLKSVSLADELELQEAVKLVDITGHETGDGNVSAKRDDETKGKKIEEPKEGESAGLTDEQKALLKGKQISKFNCIETPMPN